MGVGEVVRALNDHERNLHLLFFNKLKSIVVSTLYGCPVNSYNRCGAIFNDIQIMTLIWITRAVFCIMITI